MKDRSAKTPKAKDKPPSQTAPRKQIFRWWLATVPVLLGLGGVAIWWWTTPPSPPEKPAPSGPREYPLPAIFSSPWLNTGAKAQYVGSDKCRSCHRREERSFRRTGMGRSMALVDPEREPPNADFDHPLSQRHYQITRKEGALWHREFLRKGDQKHLLLSEFPLKYVVGSGRHSLTYLVEDDGFLMESPVTWYRSKNAWGISPGYDTADQPGFERAAGAACLVCHAGRAEALDRSFHRMQVHEIAIGCENCHGPGSLHVELRNRPGTVVDESAPDYTIVNPRRLPRKLSEAVCQQCHLQSVASVLNRGRNVADFRPGLPLEDFRQDYVYSVPDGQMTVVGHVEQLHRSRCYQMSDSLTCITCHNPHSELNEEQTVQHYRKVCLNCHETKKPCKEKIAVRHKTTPKDYCIHCHMPNSPTELPHLAFTHHRIAIHSPEAKKKDNPAQAVLRPFLENPRLSEIDRKRSLGLAHQIAANGETDPAIRARLGQRSLELLADVWDRGLRDPVLDSSLARLLSEMGLPKASICAESALTHPDIRGQERCNAMFFVIMNHLQQGRPKQGRELALQLVRLRRQSLDWVLLAECERGVGNSQAAFEALSKAVQINPRLTNVQKALADHYRNLGNERQAKWHEERAVPVK